MKVGKNGGIEDGCVRVEAEWSGSRQRRVSERRREWYDVERWSIGRYASVAEARGDGGERKAGRQRQP